MRASIIALYQALALKKCIIPVKIMNFKKHEENYTH